MPTQKEYTLLYMLIYALLVPATSTAAGSRTVTLDDLDRLIEVSDPQIAADGGRIAYTVRMVITEDNRDDTDIRVINPDGSDNRALLSSAARESMPRWRPGTGTLAFLSDDGSSTTQVWEVDAKGFYRQKLTDLPGSVSDYVFSPDGNSLIAVVSIDDHAVESDQPQPIVVDRYYFKEDETGFLGTERSQLFRVDLVDDTTTRLSWGEYDHVLPAWSPDGKRISYVTKRGADPDRHNNWDIYIADAHTTLATRQLTGNPGTDCDPELCSYAPPLWSPDGRQIAYIRGGDPALTWYALQQVATIPIDGGTGEHLPTAPADRNTTTPRWSADGKSLYYIYENDQNAHLARVHLHSGKQELLTPAGHVVRNFTLDNKGNIVVLVSSATRPFELARLKSGRLEYITAHNDWLDEIELASTEAVAYPSSDNTGIHALLVRPPGFDSNRKYPVLLRLHGGPVAQHEFEFRFDWQLYAAHGYVVIAPNPRGSSGRGEDFQKVMLSRWGSDDTRDVIAAVDYLIKQGIADEDRLGVGGWSYGGMLTNYVIATDTRFRSAVSGAGIANMLAGYGTDMYIRDWNTELGAPWQNLDAWLRVSYPFYKADRIKTPTLFMVGQEDFNVPLIGSEQMYQALRQLEVPTRLVIYPGEYHSFYDPLFRKDEYRRNLDWYDRYLK